MAKTAVSIAPGNCQSTNDSIQVRSEPGYVIVEANEWDSTRQRYLSVTLRLCQQDARLLAKILLNQAAEAEMLKRWVN